MSAPIIDEILVIDEILAEKGFILADGATGTNLFQRGLETGYPPELWNVERPDDIISLHTSFLDAGSDLVLTNSFGGNALRLKLHNAQDCVAELNEAAAVLARTAVARHRDRHGRAAIVAGSMGPTGELFEPMGALTHDTTRAVFAAQANALAEGGVDMLWIETMSSTAEVAAALEAAKATGLPVAVTMTFDTAKRSMMGVTPADFASFAGSGSSAGFAGSGSSAGFASVDHADYLGANCGIGPAELLHSVAGMRETAGGVPLIAKGNCGIPAYVDGAIHYHGTPELMADYALFARDMGVQIIGGCCGTSPEHVAAMATALATTPPRPFDDHAMIAALGRPWANVPEKPVESSRRQNRRTRSR